MAGRTAVTKPESKVEVWEVISPITIWLWTYDRRNDRYVQKRVGGNAGGSKRIQLTVDERRFNQEQIIEEMREHDPFTNGAMKRLSGPDLNPEEDYLYNDKWQLTNEDLLTLLEVKDETLFKSEIAEIGSELLLRRLSAISEKHGAIWQHEFITELIAERFPLMAGGTQKTVREMLAANELQGGTTLS